MVFTETVRYDTYVEEEKTTFLPEQFGTVPVVRIREQQKKNTVVTVESIGSRIGTILHQAHNASIRDVRNTQHHTTPQPEAPPGSTDEYKHTDGGLQAAASGTLVPTRTKKKSHATSSPNLVPTDHSINHSDLSVLVNQPTNRSTRIHQSVNQLAVPSPRLR